MNKKTVRLAAGGALALLLAGLAVPAQADTGVCGPVVDWVKYCTAADGSAYPVLINEAATGPRPVAAGALLVGNTLTVFDGAWQPADATLTHQWVRNDVPILGATGATYTLTRADAGKYVRVTTTATAPGYATSTMWSLKGVPVSNASGPIKSLQPAVTFRVEPATTYPALPSPIMVARTGRWIDWGLARDVQFNYQWLRDGEPIPGATGRTFDRTGWGPTGSLSVRVNAYAAGYDPVTVIGHAGSGSFSPATPGAVVTGGTGLGEVLTGTDDVPWHDSILGPNRYPHAYQWLRDGVAVPDATGRTYTITAEDQGHTLVLFTDTDKYDAYSNAVAVPAAAGVELKQLTNVAKPVLTGEALIGRAMSVTPGTWSAPSETLTVTYNWLSPDGKVSGTGSTYSPDANDVDTTVTVLVTALAPGYATARVRVTAPKPVTLPEPTQKVPPAISRGTLRVGGILYVGFGVWADSRPGLAQSYQWLRNGVPINGATNAGYQLKHADFATNISVKVTSTLEGRTLKTQTIKAAQNIGPATLRASTPTIAGTAKAGRIVTAKPGLWTHGTKFTYRWLRNGSPISGATASTYKVRTADRDKKISVQVTGTRYGYTTVTTGSGVLFAR
ncbi:hypothetical protein [Arthrobacter sp. 131MFCol6.1]|uniref:hypothetical protein n=1 Tax=Arthrobacter sp. 131MFCol6.1 TaxID=1157944 RepID=UPI0003A811A2|nr:hypothetical protein [Arthrobacter sp. 131MFCol6.1]